MKSSVKSKYLVALLLLVNLSVPAQASSFASGITYTGRILKGDQPLDSGLVRFYILIQTQSGCDLYGEQRDVDMTGSNGTYSFEIGAGALASDFPHKLVGIKTMSDVFDNSKATSDLDNARPGCLTFAPAFDEGRVMKVQILPPGELVVQALPDLLLTAVPIARQAFNANKVDGYGTGDLLKVDPTVIKTTYANTPLTQAQYDEFWKLILGTSTTYLKSIPTLGGDVSGTLPAVTVTKIQNIAVTAPTTGDTGKVLTYNGTGMVWSPAAAGGITTLNGLSGSTQSFVSGTTPFTITSSGSAHTFNISNASSSSSGLLTQADWNTFNSKQSGTLANGQVWIGNASNGAQAQTLSGDATVSASGNVTVDKTQTAQASKILQLDSSGNAYVAGVDIKGSSATAKLRFTGSSDMLMNLPATSGTANQFLQTDGAGNLSWASQSAMLTTISAGQIWVGNASNGAQAFSLSGDVASVSSTGAVTLTTSATGSNKLPLAGGTMSGAIDMATQNIANAGHITMANNRYLNLSIYPGAPGTAAGQMWYDSGVIKYFDGTTAKSLGVAGAGITSLNGISVGVQSFVVGTAGNAPSITSSGSTHTVDIPMASASGSVTAGLISNADYASMMAKQSNTLPSTQVWVGNASGVAQAFALSGDIFSVSNTGLVTVVKSTTGTANQIVALDGSSIGTMSGLKLPSGAFNVTLTAATTATGSYVLRLPAGTPAANQIMQSDASGNLSWVSNAANVNNAASLSNGKMWLGNASGIAVEQTMSGDATISNVGLLTLKNTGTVGTYFKVVTDAQGRVTSGSALASGDVTTALGYTPTAAGSGYVNGGNTFAGNATIGLNDAYTLGFKTNNTTRMTIDGVGNVGIGTTTPLTKFSVVDTGTDAAVSISRPAAKEGILAFATGSLPRWELLTTNAAESGSNAGSNFAIEAYDDAGSLLRTDFYINRATGKIGMGTMGPTVSLDLSAKTDAVRMPIGNTSQRPANATGLLRYNTTNSALEFNNGSAWATLASGVDYVNGGNAFASNASIGLIDNFNLDLKTNNTSRITIMNNGDVGIGTTNPKGTLHIGNNSATGSGYSALVIGNATGTHLGFDFDGVQAYNNASNNSLYLNYWGGDIAFGDGSQVKFDRSYGLILGANARIGIGVAVPSVALDASGYTDAVRLPVGNTSQRPANATGLIRYNTNNSALEFNNGSAWATLGSSAGYVNGGNSFSGNATIGLNDTYNLGFKTGGAIGMTLTSNGNLGIGTSAPATLFEVQTSSTGSKTVARFSDNTGTARPYIDVKLDDTSGVELLATYNTGIPGDFKLTSAGSNMILSTQTIERMRIDSSGNVGINTNGPGSKLHIVDTNIGAGNLSTNVQIQATGSTAVDNGGMMTFSGNDGTSDGRMFAAIAGRKEVATAGNIAGYFQVQTRNNSTGLAERMRVDSSGNLGIGTTTPQSLLDVASNATVRAVSTGQCNEGLSLARPTTALYNWVSWHTGTTSAQAPSCSDWDFMFGTQSGSTDLVIAGANTSGSPLVRTDGIIQFGRTGDVYFGRKIGIGTTSPAVAIDAGSKTDAIRVAVGNTSQRPTAANGQIRYNTTTALFEFYQNGAWVNYTVSSDARLKTNVVPVTQGLNIVNKLNPVYFDWDQNTIRGQSYGTKHQVGFIAQEVEQVLPEVVNKGEDTYRTMEYGKVVSVVVAAVKELYQKVIGLDRRVASLEAENEKLKQENADMKARLDRIEQQLDSGK